MRPALFRNRTEAGRALGRAVQIALGESSEKPDPVVLALPRGGVPVGVEVARRCDAPLDLLMVRKLGVPGRAELAVGAVVDGDDPKMVVNPDVMRMAGLARKDLLQIRDRELAEIDRRRKIYLPGRQPVQVEGRDVVVVDDGIATGATARAALKGLGHRGARRIFLAIPVAPREAVEDLQTCIDRAICLETPVSFWSVGAHYQEFDQVSDAEVVRCLRELHR